MAMTVAGWVAHIEPRLQAVRGDIARACTGCRRDPQSVRLVAVSKRHPPEAIEAAYRLGQRDFGENYVQELCDKVDRLVHLRDLRMRFIGHLQRNKARALVERGVCVDTVDSERLVEALAARAAGRAEPLPVLVQVNVGGEAQKAGVAPAALGPLVERVRATSELTLRGLMTVPPAADDPAQSRPHFARLRELAEAHGLPELSMGMTADMGVAIEEGATMVRVGTAIFGARAPI